MTPEDLRFVIDLARRRAGLALRADRGYLIEARLQPVARREGVSDLGELAARARAEPDGPLAAALVEALASSDSVFFRDRQVFERLQSHILPALAQGRGGEAVRVLSVGCGTGQEVYSLAIGAAEAATPGLDLEIFASDFSSRALQKARSGAYTHFEVQRGLPVRLLLRWFDKVDDLWRVSPKLRQTIRWAKVNLMDDLSRLGRFDVILCRNVLNGLDADAAAGVLAQLEQALAPDGWLVLGADEAPELPAGFSGAGGLFSRDPLGARRAA